MPAVCRAIAVEVACMTASTDAVAATETAVAVMTAAVAVSITGSVVTGEGLTWLLQAYKEIETASIDMAIFLFMNYPPFSLIMIIR
jgi:hypothetical protein